jgi:ectoine hydroxylase-related dioxygenase (phytanoyl-CoA dioxygenase family)
MNEIERYLFDLQGFLVIENVLDAAELATLNRLFETQKLTEPSQEGGTTSFGNFLTWGQPFCDLLDHPRLMPYLKVILGDGFRLDHYYGIYLQAGTGRLRLHGGNTPYDPPEYYHFRNGQMYNGLVVVGWNLTDTGPESGGFCCIPGSHKSNYPLPAAIADAHYKANCVVTPEVKAGSFVIFTEALTHGTAPWRADHDRRSLLYKYSPGQQSWAREHIKPPDEVELTPRQRLLFEPPYFQARTSLFEGSA